MERLKFEECEKCKDWNGTILHCMNICGKPLDALQEFNAYKDLEEQNRLLKLPCAVGDTVYCVFVSVKGTKPTIFSQKFEYSMVDSFGKSVFLTQEEAEAALKELEEHEH